MLFLVHLSLVVRSVFIRLFVYSFFGLSKILETEENLSQKNNENKKNTENFSSWLSNFVFVFKFSVTFFWFILNDTKQYFGRSKSKRRSDEDNERENGMSSTNNRIEKGMHENVFESCVSCTVNRVEWMENEEFAEWTKSQRDVYLEAKKFFSIHAMSIDWQSFVCRWRRDE